METKNLSEYACQDSDAIYLKPNIVKESPFLEDSTKILLSNTFARCQDKTQVFPFAKNNHVSRRMIHILLVSKIARTIGRGLNLNEDLIEAASLGHDTGHAPFGHEGERILNEISLVSNEGYFNHNAHSVRTLNVLENHGEGLNISAQVLDAILCHNGEETEMKYVPGIKTSEEFLKELERTYKDRSTLKRLHAMTLEGCVLRVSDVISYLGRDIEDAIRMGILTGWEEVPSDIKKVLGRTNKEIIETCIDDILNNSYGKNYIQLSAHVHEMFDKLLRFNSVRIYQEKDKKISAIQKERFYFLFHTYLEDLRTENPDSPIVSSYLAGMNEDYQNNNSRERIAIDYIAGMTDGYFIEEFKRVLTRKK